MLGLVVLVRARVDRACDREQDEHHRDAGRQPHRAVAAREVLARDAEEGYEQRPKGKQAAEDVEDVHWPESYLWLVSSCLPAATRTRCGGGGSGSPGGPRRGGVGGRPRGWRWRREPPSSSDGCCSGSGERVAHQTSHRANATGIFKITNM